MWGKAAKEAGHLAAGGCCTFRRHSPTACCPVDDKAGRLDAGRLQSDKSTGRKGSLKCVSCFGEHVLLRGFRKRSGNRRRNGNGNGNGIDLFWSFQLVQTEETADSYLRGLRAVFETKSTEITEGAFRSISLSGHFPSFSDVDKFRQFSDHFRTFGKSFSSFPIVQFSPCRAFGHHSMACNPGKRVSKPFSI